MQRQKSLIRRLCKLTQIILSIYLTSVPADFGHRVGQFRDHLLQLMEDRGIEFTLSYVKASRNCVMRYVSGSPLTECPGIGLDKRGLPNWLTPVILNQLADSESLKILLTLLTLTRAVTLKPAMDTKTIVDPWQGKDKISEREFNLACLGLGIRPGVPDFRFPHMSTKRGPQGQAILTSLSELTLLPLQLVSYIKILGGSKLGNMIDENLEGLDILEAVRPLILRGKPFFFSVAH